MFKNELQKFYCNWSSPLHQHNSCNVIWTENTPEGRALFTSEWNIMLTTATRGGCLQPFLSWFYSLLLHEQNGLSIWYCQLTNLCRRCFEKVIEVPPVFNVQSNGYWSSLIYNTGTSISYSRVLTGFLCKIIFGSFT